MHHDAEVLGRRHDLFGHLDIGARRGGVARGWLCASSIAVADSSRSALHHLALMDPGVVDGALLLHLVGDDLVAFVEEQYTELLLGLEAHRGAAIFEHLAPGGEHHYLGHRERLRRRFREAGADALQDYELLEMILFRAVPRRHSGRSIAE